MALMDTLYLDTPASAEAVEAMLVDEMGLQRSAEGWRERGWVPWLHTGERGLVLVKLPNEDTRGPFDYPQAKTVMVRLNHNNEEDNGSSEYLKCLAGDLLQRFPGDATLTSEGGGTVLVRRDGTVWVDPDPFNLEHLFAGTFRPAKLVHGLPPAAPPGPDPYADEDEDAPAAAQ